MKKLISLISGLALTLGIGAVSASASEFLDYKPQIVYNAETTAIEDVRMTDGRVFIPLRAVFEMMGATVDYAGETGNITVVREDTKIEFYREGTSMTITDLKGVNPVQVIDAEIRCDYNINRTFVPVRFISNALGARVGWDGESGSVYILDTYTLAKDLVENTPKLAELLKTTAVLNENVKSNAELSMSFGITTPERPAMNAGIKVNVAESEFDSKSTYGVKFDFTHENLDVTTGYNIGQLEDVTFDILKDENALYFKTNAVSKIKTFLPEEELLHLAEKVVTPDTWFEVDYAFVEKEFGKVIADALFKDEKFDSAAFDSDAAVDYFVSVLAASTVIGGDEGDITYIDMVAEKAVFEYLKSLFSNITIENAADGSTTIKMSWATDDFISLIVGRELFENDEEYNAALAEVKKHLVFDMNLTEKIADNMITSEDANFNFSVNDGEGTVLTLEIKGTGTAEKLETAPEFKVPEQTLSMQTVMTLLDM